jgi:O-methyltransferase
LASSPASSTPSPAFTEAQQAYLDLLKKCLTRTLWGDGNQEFEPPARGLPRWAYASLRAFLRRRGLRIVRPAPFDLALREVGRDWPAEAETMVGLRRLDNLQDLIGDVCRRAVPGDLLETGVWRGGAVIFMRGVLKAIEDDRRVWVCDSFAGLPRPDPVTYPADADDPHWTFSHLVVPLEQVRANFARYGLLDDRVVFVPGWFRETLPGLGVERLSLLRLDGDMYESTHVALEALYPKLSPGGYLVVDDYGAVPGCRKAVTDFRSRHAIADPIHEIDWTGIYWRRT